MVGQGGNLAASWDRSDAWVAQVADLLEAWVHECEGEPGMGMWVPAINNLGGFGRWAFLEIRDPWDAQNEIRQLLEATAADA